MADRDGSPILQDCSIQADLTFNIERQDTIIYHEISIDSLCWMRFLISRIYVDKSARAEMCVQYGQATLLNLRREHPGRFRHGQHSSSTPWTSNWSVIVHGERRLLGTGQRTTFSTFNNAICNGHPRDAAGGHLSRRYYQRELRSLSFPRKSPCCQRLCCNPRNVVWSESS